MPDKSNTILEKLIKLKKNYLRVQVKSRQQPLSKNSNLNLSAQSMHKYVYVYVCVIADCVKISIFIFETGTVCSSLFMFINCQVELKTRKYPQENVI